MRLTLAILLLAVGVAVAEESLSLTFEDDDGARTATLRMRGGLVSSWDWAQALDLNLTWDPITERAVASHDGQQATFALGLATMLVTDEVAPLSAAPVAADGEVWLPVDGIQLASRRLLRASAVHDLAARTLVVRTIVGMEGPAPSRAKSRLVVDVHLASNRASLAEALGQRLTGRLGIPVEILAEAASPDEVAAAANRARGTRFVQVAPGPSLAVYVGMENTTSGASWSATQNRHLAESSRWAALLSARLEIGDAVAMPLVVLQALDMPGVVLQAPDDASPDAIADAIAEAFLDTLAR